MGLAGSASGVLWGQGSLWERRVQIAQMWLSYRNQRLASSTCTHDSKYSPSRVARPWIGITGLSINEELSKELGLAVEQGVLIDKVVPKGPADQAGLRGGSRPAIVGGIRFLYSYVTSYDTISK